MTAKKPTQVVLAPLGVRIVAWVVGVTFVLIMLYSAWAQLRALFLLADVLLLSLLLVCLTIRQERKVSLINPWILIILVMGTFGWGMMALVSLWLQVKWW